MADRENYRRKRSLSVRILSILFVTFAPVLIVLMIITINMFSNMYEQAIAANKNEMSIFMNQFDNDVESATQAVRELAVEYRTRLYNHKDPKVIFYNLWNYLGEIRSEHPIIDVTFVKNDQDISFSYSKGEFTRDNENQFREQLQSLDISNWSNFSYYMISVNQHNYMILYVVANGYEFGYLVDTDILMEQFSEEMKNKNFFTMENPQTDDSRVLIVQSAITDGYLVRNISSSYLYQAFPVGRVAVLVVAALSFILFPIQWKALRRYVLHPLDRIGGAMKELEKENLDYQMEILEETEEFEQIELGFNSMAEQIKNLKIESYEKDINRLRIENLNLRLQVNPHMLLNCLNMIYSLSKSHNEAGVQDMAICLSKYFQYVLYNDREFSKVKDEIGFISSYMEIQRIRFPGAFCFVYDVEPTLMDAEVPTMLIQNFVENSIKYALNMETEIDIMVIIKEKGQKLSISVIDTGNGMEHEILQKLKNDEVFEDYRGTHIGVWNCRKRLQLHYGEDAEFSISSKMKEGTQVWMEIPFKKVGDEE